MTPISIWLAALGVADLLASPGGTKPRERRAAVASAVGSVIAALAITGSGYGLHPFLIVLLAVGAGLLLAVWTIFRCYVSTPRGASVALAGLGTVTLAIAATAELWPQSDGGVILRWFSRLPYETLTTSPERTLAAISVVLGLLATGNAVVRLSLEAVMIKLDREQGPESRLKGGRLIGPIERTLLFVLVAAGEPTAAALIISAKGLLRFPELGNASRDPDDTTSIDVLTEYLLVGSMVSWSVALAPIAILP